MPSTETIQPPKTPFVNEVRLGARHWMLAGGIVLLIVLGLPWLWKKVERFHTGPDYRLPYRLSKDYWLYERRLQQIAPTNIVVLGDSVVWGEYVLPDGTLSHFLNREAGQPNEFVNAGVNGLFPLALEGLVRYYGAPMHRHKVLLQCNVLWMSSPKADLNIRKEEAFNHANLVPQFYPRIPCYKADINDRLEAVVERNVPFIEWARHLQSAYFGDKSILKWTLENDGNDPPHYPNLYKDPFAQITFTVPGPPTNDPERGPRSPRHKPWSTTGQGTARFEWVDLDHSLQWAAFRRLIALLQSHNDDVLVLVGPFNEHIMAEENRAAYRRLRDGIDQWLTENHISHLVPEALPSEALRGCQPSVDGRICVAGETDLPRSALPAVGAKALNVAVTYCQVLGVGRVRKALIERESSVQASSGCVPMMLSSKVVATLCPRRNHEEIFLIPVAVKPTLEQTQIAGDFFVLPALAGAYLPHLIGQSEGFGEVEVDERAVAVSLRPIAHRFFEVIGLFFAEFLHPLPVGAFGGGLEIGGHKKRALLQRLFAASSHAFEPTGGVIIRAWMRLEKFAITLLRSQEKRDAVVRPRNHQRGVLRGQAGDNVAAQPVAEEDGVEFAGRDRFDALLKVGVPELGRVVIALGQELQIGDVWRPRRTMADFAKGDLAGDDFEKHGRSVRWTELTERDPTGVIEGGNQSWWATQRMACATSLR